MNNTPDLQESEAADPTHAPPDVYRLVASDRAARWGDANLRAAADLVWRTAASRLQRESDSTPKPGKTA